MPYIARGLRLSLEATLRPLCAAVRHNPQAGVLNYVITRLVLAWLGDAPRYGDYNAAIGALECAKLELYRKQIAPHEDDALVANGPIVDA